MIIWSHLHGMPTELWMAAERAVSEDKKDLRRACVGCVILRNDGALVSSKNGASHGRRMPSAHAEARCSKKADKNSVAYVARVLKDGSIGCARPCKSCRVKLRSRGVIDAFFTVGPNEWGRMRMHDESEYTWSTKTIPVPDLPW